MHYTSWGERKKTDGHREIPLFVEDGPEELGRFVVDGGESAATAVVEGVEWRTAFDRDTGATATLPDGTVYQASGDFARGKEIDVRLGDRRLKLINENRNDWIVDDENSVKLAQFSGAAHGVRRSILEFEDDVAAAGLSRSEAAALSWFVRLVLESRLGVSSAVLILTLVLFTIVGILAFIL
ncbi:hypothetical protein [Corynebacterium halotolerans]|uniref:Uncharacterized protein n=1 Tax=Corynebacterium halotolerans YIM 70093 = DSM 44683 TaxID=1121362 RepID=M1P8S9_9CORY|nr:hypothetical protein [Corynebacterium halotolerans]AGF73071.1 hypothetical protein A605_10355 [Corynebacterium halotolerans YIM 70093 = DSM 44683]